jgi:hypothetical protein
VGAQFILGTAHVPLSVRSGANVSGGHIPPNPYAVRLNNKFLFNAAVATMPRLGKRRGGSGKRQQPKR